MVIITENKVSKASSNLDKAVCVSVLFNILGKGKNPIFLHFAMGK